MTRQQIIQEAMDQIGETQSTPGGASMGSYNSLINLITDEICKKTDCFYTSVVMDVTANQSTYCAPAASTGTEAHIYEIKGIFWTNSSGDKTPLQPMTPEELDSINRNWRNDTAGSPRCAVMHGMNEFILYPTPDTSLTAGLQIEGFAKPGNSWSAAGAQCPIPGGDSSAWIVIWGVCERRCNQFGDADNRVQLPYFAQQYRQTKADFFVESQRSNPAFRGKLADRLNSRY